jgi:hypothetical protein
MMAQAHKHGAARCTDLSHKKIECEELEIMIFLIPGAIV